MKFLHDRGGNRLFYTKLYGLHALWDTKLVNKLAHSKEPAPLVELLTKDVTADLYTARGEYRDWPAKWVSDSATEAIGAYNGLVFGPVNLKVAGKIDRT